MPPVRYDVLYVLRRLFEETRDEAVQAEALALIEAEPDEKNAKKDEGALASRVKRWRGWGQTPERVNGPVYALTKKNN